LFNHPVLAVATGMLLVAAGCQRAGAPPAAVNQSPAPASSGNPYLAKPGDPLTPVSVAWCNPSGGFLQLYAARDANLFAKYGLDVKASLVRGSETSLAALQAGQLDFVYCAGSATIPGMAAGADAVLIGAPLTGLAFVLMARPGIRSVQDLRGKSIGISRTGDLLDRLGRAMLSYLGMPADSVTLRALGGQTEEYQGLRAGVVDAAILSPPLDAQGKKEGMTMIFDFKQLPIPFIYSALHTSSRMIRERPQVVQRFVAAMAEAVYYTETHKAEAEQALAKELKLSDQDALDAAYQAYSRDIVNRGLDVSLTAVQDSIDYARQQGTKIQRGKAADMVNNQFVDDLRKSGFLEALWGRPIPPPSTK
jgi:NitT/TauT family transport system substrate-binding protein